MATGGKRKSENHSWLALLEQPGSDASVRPVRVRRYLMTSSLLLVGLAMTGLMYTAVKQNDVLRAERAFEAMASSPCT